MKPLSLFLVAMFAHGLCLSQEVSPDIENTKHLVENRTVSRDQTVYWSENFDGDSIGWTFHCDLGSNNWQVTDTCITGLDYVNGEDFYDTCIPLGSEVNSFWLYMGRRDLGEYSLSGGNFAWIDGVTDVLAGTEEVQNAWIQFDSIDLSLADHPSISFYQNFKQLNDGHCYFEYSIDNGTNWVSKELFLDIKYIKRYATDYYKINLISELPNEPNVSIRFRWETTSASYLGYHYGWQLDDIMIFENPDYEIELVKGLIHVFNQFEPDPDYYEGLHYYGHIPYEVSKFCEESILGFASVLKNDGNCNIRPVAKVDFSRYGEIVFSDVKYLDTILSGDMDTVIFDYQSLNDLALGEYDVKYTIESEFDYDLENNCDSCTFDIEFGEYSHERENFRTRYSLSHLSGKNQVACPYFFYSTWDGYDIYKVKVFVHNDTDVGSKFRIHVLEEVNHFDTQFYHLHSTDTIVVGEDMLNQWYVIRTPRESCVFYPNDYMIAILAVVEFIPEDGKYFYIGVDPTVPRSLLSSFVKLDNFDDWEFNAWRYGGLGIRIDINRPCAVDDETQDDYVYPNPTNRYVDIYSQENSFVDVYNLHGISVAKWEVYVGDNTLDFGSLPAGVYFLKGNSFVKKIILTD